MYEDLMKLARHCSEVDACINCPVGGCQGVTGIMNHLADAVEERDKYVLSLQHEMMAEAESHIEAMGRLNKQIDELQKKYAEVLKAAHSMHTWIFLNSGDEQKAYDECGLTDEMNAVLGYGGQYVAEPPKEDGWYQVYSPGYSGGSSSGLKNIQCESD